MKKLQRFAHFINQPLQQRLSLIKNAKVIQNTKQQPFNIIPKQYQEENFISLRVFDTIRLQTMYKLQTYRQNSKNGKPKAVVVFFHGLGSHLNLSGHLAHYLAEQNITTVGFDFRGFGKSQGNRAYIQSLQTHMKDTQQFIRMVKQIYPETPLFATGLSLGGLTAYQLTLKHPEWFKGAVMLAPALMPATENANRINVLINLLRFLQSFLPSDLKIFKPYLDTLCRYSGAIQLIKNDQLFIKHRLPIRTILTLLTAMRDTPQTFNRYVCPFLVVMGGRDKIIDPQVAFHLFQKTKTEEKDKDILFYEEMWHVIPFEPEFNEIKEKIANWVLMKS